MPVTTTRPPTPDTSRYGGLVAALATELRHPKPFGRPDVREEALPRSDFFSTTVVWDEWSAVDDVDRPDIIIDAYRAAAAGRADHIAYALGYTTVEAYQAGLLSHWITLAPGADRDELTTESCLATLLELGGSAHPGQQFPMLWLCDRGQAEAYWAELLRRHPGSESNWLRGQEMRFGSVTRIG